MKSVLLGILRALALMGMLIAGYCIGYYQRGHTYKQWYEVQMELDKLPESGAIRAITHSEVGRKYADVEIRNLSTVQYTNERPNKRDTLEN